MLMYGTTMFLIQVAVNPSPRASLWTTMGVYPNSMTIAAGMATSGAVTSWFREIAGTPSYESLLQEAASAGEEPLIVLPYFAGERSPIFDPLARGLILGLTVRHTRGDLYRAILEGTAYSVRHNLEVMSQGSKKPTRLVAVGGGTKGDLWTQIVSDVTGYDQQLPRVRIGASYGDALLAGIGAGLVPATETWSVIDSVVEPNRKLSQKYDQLYGIYRQLYADTGESMHALAAVMASD
jgi:xylulokinase